MREYQCHTKCASRLGLSRPGDIRIVEESTFKKVPEKIENEAGELETIMVYADPIADFFERHWALISDDKKPTKTADPEAGVKAFLKKHNIAKKVSEQIFEKAQAVEPHEKLMALTAYVEAKQKG